MHTPRHTHCIPLLSGYFSVLSKNLIYSAVCMWVFALCIIACNPQKSTLSLIIVQKCKRHHSHSRANTHAHKERPNDTRKNDTKRKRKQPTLWTMHSKCLLHMNRNPYKCVYTRINDKIKRPNTWKYWFGSSRCARNLWCCCHIHAFRAAEHIQTNFYFDRNWTIFGIIFNTLRTIADLIFHRREKQNDLKNIVLKLCASWLGFVPINYRYDVFCVWFDASPEMHKKGESKSLKSAHETMVAAATAADGGYDEYNVWNGSSENGFVVAVSNTQSHHRQIQQLRVLSLFLSLPLQRTTLNIYV